MRTVLLARGVTVPALGIGTWYMAEDPRRRRDEAAALQTAVDLGMSLVDTAEMYGSGRAESLVGEALGHRRSDTFLVSKVLPQHATASGTVRACEGTLRRLQTDHLDLYLLHWRGRVPLAETLEGFERLTRDGKIRHWGVSNFDVDDMEELWDLDGGRAAATNQVLYNLTRRGIEYDLEPWCRARHIPLMAYSPLEQGVLVKDASVRAAAARLGATPAQVALAWVMRNDGVITIPKAGHPDRVRENYNALQISLSPADLAALDRAFPAPKHKTPLEMI